MSTCTSYVHTYAYLNCGYTHEWIISLINPQRACAARVTVVVPCVCVCMFVHSFLPPHVDSIGTNGFTATHKNFYNRVFVVAKNASFRSYGIICLPRMPPTTLKPQETDTEGISRRLEIH